MSLTSIALHPHEHPRRALFSPDGSRFLIADDKRLVLYDRDGTALTETALLPDGRVAQFVFGLAWSPDDVHIVTAESDALRLRRASDLSIITERKRFGRGPVAFSGANRLALASWSDLCVVEVPSLADLGSLTLEWGKYESFDIDHVVADPTGTFVAATDYGGYSEDEWGHTADRGIPKVTIVDATAPTIAVHSLTQRQPVGDLELDRWRKRLLVANYKEIVVRDFSAAQIATWTAYGSTANTKAIAVCERYVVTIPDSINARIELAIDFWDPETYAHQRRVPFLDADRKGLLSMRPWWLSPSPDGSRLIVHEPGGVRVFAT